MFMCAKWYHLNAGCLGLPFNNLIPIAKKAESRPINGFS
jgi:hypothetical protein